MYQKIIKYGLIAGFIVGAILFGSTVAMADKPPSMGWGMALGYASMLIALSAIFIGVKTYRDRDLGGVIRFWPAFGMGLAISFVASICYVLAWEAALMVTKMDFAGEYAKMLIDQKKAQGITGDALKSFVAEMEQFKTMYANPLMRMGMTILEILPVGILVSLISAGLLRNSRFLAVQRA